MAFGNKWCSSKCITGDWSNLFKLSLMTVNCSKCKNLETQVRALETTESFTPAESKVIQYFSELICINFGCDSMSWSLILIGRLLSVDSLFEVADQAIFEMRNWLDRMPGSKGLFSLILCDLKLSIHPGTSAMVFELICDEELTSDNKEIEFSVVSAVNIAKGRGFLT